MDAPATRSVKVIGPPGFRVLLPKKPIRMGPLTPAAPEWMCPAVGGEKLIVRCDEQSEGREAAELPAAIAGE